MRLPSRRKCPGRSCACSLTDNQDVNAGDLLLQIDPRIYQARVDQARASLAAARSSLEQAKALLNVDLAKVDQEKANVIATDAQAKFAAADFQRYRSVGALAVSESQLDLSGTQARSRPRKWMWRATANRRPKRRLNSTRPTSRRPLLKWK